MFYATYTYVLLSFILFLIICYVKISPIINGYILQYRKKALQELEDAMVLRETLEKRLKKILDSDKQFQSHIDQINQKCEDDLETLHTTYSQHIQTLHTEKQNTMISRCERYKKKLTNNIKNKISAELNAELIAFFLQAKKTQDFNSNTIKKAVEFVQNHVS